MAWEGNMIHEFLSSDWCLNPQIDYLLWIQNIRAHLSPVFDTIFLNITAFGEIFLTTFVISIVYWCIDTEAGLYLFGLNSLGLLFIQILKTTACIYRPWILSDKIKPVKAALAMAKGYSFPSGHSMISATSWGGFAFLLRKKKIISGLIIGFILLIGFSRTYLGVHTPQDVIIGLLTGLILVFVMHHVLEWCKKDKNRYLYLLGILDFAIISTLIYIILKKYPIDYVNGKMLVNPYGAKYVSVMLCGWILGIVNGLLLCKRFFPFDAKSGSVITKTIRGIIGGAILYILLYPANEYFMLNICRYRICVSCMFIMGFFITAIYPLIFSNIEKVFLKKNKN